MHIYSGTILGLPLLLKKVTTFKCIFTCCILSTKKDLLCIFDHHIIGTSLTVSLVKKRKSIDTTTCSTKSSCLQWSVKLPNRMLWYFWFHRTIRGFSNLNLYSFPGLGLQPGMATPQSVVQTSFLQLDEWSSESSTAPTLQDRERNL